ncbi:uncharacterized protein LOC144156163 [Haemaphysalis longicornis]
MNSSACIAKLPRPQCPQLTLHRRSKHFRFLVLLLLPRPLPALAWNVGFRSLRLDTFPVLITVIVNPTEFYVIPQVEDDLEKCVELAYLRWKTCTSAWPPVLVASYPPKFDEVKQWSCWNCRYERNGNWYRVRVTKIAPEDPDQRAEVHLVDFGDRVAVPVSDLRPLPAHLAELPACAHRMARSLVAPRDVDARWDKEAIDFFAANTGLDTVLEARRKGRRQLGLPRPQCPQLTLHRRSKNFRFLVLLLLPRPLPALAWNVGFRSLRLDTFPVLITVIVNPTEFYVIPQVEDDLEKKMEDMQKRLAVCAVASYPPTFEKVKQWSCWICRYERDGNWHRVRVTKIVPKRPDVS